MTESNPPTELAPTPRGLSEAPVAHPLAADGVALPGGAFHKPIRSFVRRAGRTTAAQARAVDALAPQFVVPYRPGWLDVDTTFGRPAPVVLEIGFGMGEATAHIAEQLPHLNFLCCEVHEPGVGALLKRIGERGIGNIRIVRHDAVEVIDHMIAPASLHGIHLFFPDPWHKARHNKRRLVQAPLVTRLAQRLMPGGYFHAATDWEPYAEQMLAVFSAEPLLRNTANGYAPRPDYRPLTKFENRGLKLGHRVADLVFRRPPDELHQPEKGAIAA